MPDAPDTTIDAVLDAAVLADDCPVTPLGLVGQVYFYVSARGDMRALRYNDHGPTGIDHLFGGDDTWLREHFPRHDKKGENVIGYDVGAVRRALFAACDELGDFDPYHDIRGRGLWRADEGHLVLHAGTAVHVIDPDGRVTKQPPGARVGRTLYPREQAMPGPALRDGRLAPATPSDVQGLAAHLQSWRWRAPDLAWQLLLGYIGGGYYCGALHWRPHVMLIGARGTGKTGLEDVIQALHGSRGVMRSPNISEAAVRQVLNRDALPVMLGEFENRPEGGALNDIVRLARIASSEGEGAAKRGSPDGIVKDYPVRSCFAFSAINPPRLLPQDASRITMLELDELPADAQAAEAARKRTHALHELGPALRARMIAGIERFHLNLEMYRQALVAAGCDSRQCDQFGTLLACADVLLSDHPTDADTAQTVVDQIGPAALLPDEKEDDDAWECLNRLATWPIRTEGTGGGSFDTTLGERIQSAIGQTTPSGTTTTRRHGVTVMNEDGRTFVVVAHRGEPLRRIYAGTHWSDNWKVALARVPGATRVDKVVHFAGWKGRGVWLPASAFEGAPVRVDDCPVNDQDPPAPDDVPQAVPDGTGPGDIPLPYVTPG